MVTVSTVASSESPTYSLSATGIVVVAKFVKMIQKIRALRYNLFNLAKIREKFVFYIFLKHILKTKDFDKIITVLDK